MSRSPRIYPASRSMAFEAEKPSYNAPRNSLATHNNKTPVSFSFCDTRHANRVH